jgi:hypothetical protein
MRDIISSTPAYASTSILLLLKEPQGEEFGVILKAPVRISQTQAQNSKTKTTSKNELKATKPTPQSKAPLLFCRQTHNRL